MAKPTKQASPQAEEQQPLHPVLRNLSQVDDMVARLKDRKEAQEFKITEIERWKECVNGIAATPNGQLFLKSMVQHSGLFDPGTIAQPQKMIESRIISAFYLKWVRPFLNPDLRKDIE